MELLTIILISSVANIITLLAILFFTRKKKKTKHPLQERAEDLLLMVNQTILSLHREIQKQDQEITQMMYKKDVEKSHEKQIEEQINEQKEAIKVNMYNIDTLKEFKLELQKIIGLKEITNENEIEKKLDDISSFVRSLVRY
ncbi:MAG: hypothetical protein ACTSYD_12260 [Candidatus Heimdallarchaeaceae archaeon]